MDCVLIYEKRRNNAKNKNYAMDIAIDVFAAIFLGDNFTQVY